MFERHSPERVALVPNATRGIRARHGDHVQLRSDLAGDVVYEVTSVQRGSVRLRPLLPDSGESDVETLTVKEQDLLVLRSFGDPVYPGLTCLGRVEGSDTSGPAHAVISGENFHALQLLVHGLEGEVDCIYIDPPYNTGSTDWKYNNKFVDADDSYRHSRWLSFMEKRLKLAKKLLNPDTGVLVVTIDEHEVHRLGLLLEQVFRGYEVTTVSIVIAAKGNPKPNTNFARVEEYALFVYPLNSGGVAEVDRDLLDETTKLSKWKSALRGGPDSSRTDRPNMFYPIFIDPATGKAVDVGEPLLDGDPNYTPRSGLVPTWPIRSDGSEGRWGVAHDTMKRKIMAGELRIGAYDVSRKFYPVSYLTDAWKSGQQTKKVKTVWRQKSHDAGANGTTVVNDFVGGRDVFDFPKSLYAVRDTLAAVVGPRRDALILDFFAGSGTTLHATALLNAEDGGTRRCILVTNNEVSKAASRRLVEAGAFPGDALFEAEGVFERVTRPRTAAALTGHRQDGTPVPGTYPDESERSLGLPGAVEYFRLDYLDKDSISLGRQFDHIHPILWLSAGGYGLRPSLSNLRQAVFAPEGCRYAVLLRPEAHGRLAEVLRTRPDITHVWVVTDDADTFAASLRSIPERVRVSQMYRPYVNTFTINTEANL